MTSNRPLRILMASAEVSPLSRVGGLAEVTAGLAAALGRSGVEVTVATPRYRRWEDLGPGPERRLAAPEWVGTATAAPVAVDDGVRLELVDLPGIDRDHPYNDPATGVGWDDNDRRFLGFAAAVAALARVEQPDVVHLHDWHAAAATAWLDEWVPTVLTVHNLAYQGQCHRRWVKRLGPAGPAFDLDRRTNPLAGGIALADRVVSVSPTYVMESRRPALGMGLDDLLRARNHCYLGIRNGIDTERWNPAGDPLLPHRFDVNDLSGKDRCRSELAQLAGLADDRSPILGMVCRFVDQKGVDIALEVATQLRGLGARLVLMGVGDPRLEGAAAAVAALNERVVYLPTDDEPTAHLVMAGADLLLVPSRFEPCGLTPMEAMRCGTIPVVSPVGGLRDTVIDASADGVKGNGFIAPAADSLGMSLAVGRAVRALSDPARRTRIQRNGMTADWSWRLPAVSYRELYDEVLEERAASIASASAAPISAATRSRISARAFEGAPAS